MWLLLLACAVEPPTDVDGDGFATDDCDDGDAAVFPGAPETCDGQDDDCDGVADEGVGTPFWADEDGDGSGSGVSSEHCSAPTGYAAADGDCDDADPEVHPGAVERCNGVDDDCDGAGDPAEGTWYTDADGDGYGDPATGAAGCEPGDGQVADASDCDDGDADAHPAAAERCNAADDDCDGATDEDFEADGDGYASVWCGGEDCDDADAEVFPGAEDACGDGLDADCSGDDPTCTWGGDRAFADADAILYASANSDAGRQIVSGDVDGDGYDDLLIGAHVANGYEGRAFLVPGPASGTASLSSVAYTLEGDPVAGMAGRSVAIGDVDGDGAPDVGVGAPGAVDREYILFGPVAGDVDLSAADAIVGTDDGTHTAHGGAFGDVTGDGVADVVLGSYTDSTGAYFAGIVRVAPGPIAAGEQSLEDLTTARFLGDQPTGYVGRYVRAGGDFDGDGVGDILVAAPFTALNGPQSGGAYVVSGGWTGDLVASDADAILTAEGTGDYAGEEIAFGDVNGDGLSDALVGAQEGTAGTYAGAAYVVFGPMSGTIDLATADILVRGSTAGMNLGLGLAAGDVDGDGADDLLVGGPSSAGASASWLFLAPSPGTYAETDATASFSGAAGDSGGQSVAIGDFDGDGMGEAALGAPGDTLGGGMAGAVYVFGPGR